MSESKQEASTPTQRDHDRMLSIGVHVEPCSVCDEKAARKKLYAGTERIIFKSIQCCKCWHVGRKLECRECGHHICLSCKETN
jgi:hypothetical protein